MKLSKSKKDQLVVEVLSRKFDDREKSLKQKGSIYIESEIQKELKGVPWKACTKWIKLIKYARIDGRGHGMSFDLKESYPSVSQYSTQWIYKKGYSKEIDSLIAEIEVFNTEKDEAKQVLKSVMNSVNTEKQLIETIPEMQPLLATLFDSGVTTSIVAIETVEKAKALLS